MRLWKATDLLIPDTLRCQECGKLWSTGHQIVDGPPAAHCPKCNEPNEWTRYETDFECDLPLRAIAVIADAHCSELGVDPNQMLKLPGADPLPTWQHQADAMDNMLASVFAAVPNLREAFKAVDWKTLCA